MTEEEGRDRIQANAAKAQAADAEDRANHSRQGQRTDLLAERARAIDAQDRASERPAGGNLVYDKSRGVNEVGRGEAREGEAGRVQHHSRPSGISPFA